MIRKPNHKSPGKASFLLLVAEEEVRECVEGTGYVGGSLLLTWKGLHGKVVRVATWS